MDAQGPLGGSPDRRRSLSGDGGNLKYVMLGLVLLVAGAFVFVQHHYAPEGVAPVAVPVVASPVEPSAKTATKADTKIAAQPAVAKAPVEPETRPDAKVEGDVKTAPKMIVQPLEPPPAPAKPVHAKAPKHHAAHTTAASLPHLPSPPPGDDG